jgi:hypothetical protein
MCVCVCRGSGGGGRWKWHKLQNAERAEPGDAGEGAFSLSRLLSFIHSWIICDANARRGRRWQPINLSLSPPCYLSLSPCVLKQQTPRMFSLLIRPLFIRTRTSSLRPNYDYYIRAAEITAFSECDEITRTSRYLKNATYLEQSDNL